MCQTTAWKPQPTFYRVPHWTPAGSQQPPGGWLFSTWIWLQEGKKKKRKIKKNRSLLRLFRTVPRSASINGILSPLLCCNSWLQKTLKMWFLRGTDVHSDGLGLFFFLSFYVLKMLLGSLHCISDTLRLLIIYTEWEKCYLNFHLTKKMLWREK